MELDILQKFVQFLINNRDKGTQDLKFITPSGVIWDHNRIHDECSYLGIGEMYKDIQTK